MLGSLKLNIGNLGIVVSRGPEDLSKAFLDEVAEIDLPISAVIPEDPALLEYDMERKSLLELPDDSLSVVAIDEMLKETCPA